MRARCDFLSVRYSLDIMISGYYFSERTYDHGNVNVPEAT
jgi:hypothetical protein